MKASAVSDTISAESSIGPTIEDNVQLYGGGKAAKRIAAHLLADVVQQ